MNYKTSSWSDDFFVTSTEDGSLLTCSAYVIDPSDVIIASVTVVVNCEEFCFFIFQFRIKFKTNKKESCLNDNIK